MPAIRLHVVGCPRSGATLMSELLRYAFSFGGVAEQEQSIFVPIVGAEYPYLSKKTSDRPRIDRVFEKDPNLYVIALVRDPRAVITSVHFSNPGRYYVGYARWRDYMESICRHLEHPRYLGVRYEELIAHPTVVQRRIEAEFLFLQSRREFQT